MRPVARGACGLGVWTSGCRGAADPVRARRRCVEARPLANNWSYARRHEGSSLGRRAQWQQRRRRRRRTNRGQQSDEPPRTPSHPPRVTGKCLSAATRAGWAGEARGAARVRAAAGSAPPSGVLTSLTCGYASASDPPPPRPGTLPRPRLAGDAFPAPPVAGPASPTAADPDHAPASPGTRPSSGSQAASLASSRRLSRPRTCPHSWPRPRRDAPRPSSRGSLLAPPTAVTCPLLPLFPLTTPPLLGSAAAPPMAVFHLWPGRLFPHSGLLSRLPETTPPPLSKNFFCTTSIVIGPVPETLIGLFGRAFRAPIGLACRCSAIRLVCGARFRRHPTTCRTWAGAGPETAGGTGLVSGAERVGPRRAQRVGRSVRNRCCHLSRLGRLSRLRFGRLRFRRCGLPLPGTSPRPRAEFLPAGQRARLLPRER